METAVARALAGAQREAPVKDLSTIGARVAGSFAETAALLSKETKNAFGAMAPRDAASGTRRVRGGALYELASRVNHDCFPNVARSDNFPTARAERDAFVTFQSEGHDRKEDASGSFSLASRPTS